MIYAYNLFDKSHNKNSIQAVLVVKDSEESQI